jgi:hypothetical protein
MKHRYFRKQPVGELNFFTRTYRAKLYDYSDYSIYLIADESNPNNSPFIAIEHSDETKGYECDVFEYDKRILFSIVGDLCNITNLGDITNNVRNICNFVVDLLKNRNEQP